VSEATATDSARPDRSPSQQASRALGDVRAGMLEGDIAQFLPDARATIENISRLPLE